jgi:hypothetical protein
VTTWLIDKSALVRLAASPDAADRAARIERRLVRITTVSTDNSDWQDVSAEALCETAHKPLPRKRQKP